MRQYEAVVHTMRLNGGYATLSDLYRLVPAVEGCAWATKTPYASIRRILQVRQDLFFRIEPGLWALQDMRREALSRLGLQPQESQKRRDEFGHTYYQGLLVEIGNLKGYQTFVPKQDRNRPFLGRCLGDTITLPDMPPFTYGELVQRATMADVVWLNQRSLPSAFFEVEHSTNIHNSLLRFVEFQDFRARFYIVADGMRKRECQAKLTSTAFQPIRQAVVFMDYESLSTLHSRISDATMLERQLGL